MREKIVKKFISSMLAFSMVFTGASANAISTSTEEIVPVEWRNNDIVPMKENVGAPNKAPTTSWRDVAKRILVGETLNEMENLWEESNIKYILALIGRAAATLNFMKWLRTRVGVNLLWQTGGYWVIRCLLDLEDCRDVIVNAYDNLKWCGSNPLDCFGCVTMEDIAFMAAVWSSKIVELLEKRRAPAEVGIHFVIRVPARYAHINRALPPQVGRYPSAVPAA